VRDRSAHDHYFNDAKEKEALLEGIQEILLDLRKRSNIWESVFDIPEKELRIRELDKETLREGFWNEPDKAKEILQEQSRLNEAVAKWKRQINGLDDLVQLYEMASEEEDGQVQEEIKKDLERLSASVREDELKMMLGSEQDSMNAIMSIHAGAGGTEAQDWAEMLLRMYLRWAERKGFAATIIDYLPGDEAGLKSVTWTLRENTPLVMPRPRSVSTAS